jgi:hypothetical protein
VGHRSASHSRNLTFGVELRLRMTESCFAQPRTDSTDAPSAESPCMTALAVQLGNHSGDERRRLRRSAPARRCVPPASRGRDAIAVCPCREVMSRLVSLGLFNGETGTLRSNSARMRGTAGQWRARALPKNRDSRRSQPAVCATHRSARAITRPGSHDYRSSTTAALLLGATVSPVSSHSPDS